MLVCSLVTLVGFLRLRSNRKELEMEAKPKKLYNR